MESALPFKHHLNYRPVRIALKIAFRWEFQLATDETLRMPHDVGRPDSRLNNKQPFHFYEGLDVALPRIITGQLDRASDSSMAGN